MTDTPIQPPVTRLDRIKAFIGDLARPFAIIVTSLSAAIATVLIALRVTSFGEGAIFIAAVFAGVGGLYGVKSWEVAKTGKQSAEVEIAKAKTDAG